MRKSAFYIALIFAVLVFVLYDLRHHQYLVQTYEFDDWGVGPVIYIVWPWLVTLFIALIGYIIGAWILNVFELERFGGKLEWVSQEREVYATAVGLGAITTLTFILGWLRLIYSPFFLVLAVIILALGFRQVIGLFRSIRKPGFGFLEWTLFAVIALWVYKTAITACNPSVGIDAISTHLVASKWYLSQHAVDFNPWFSFHQFQGMLVTIQMMLLPDPCATMTYFFMLATVAAIYLIGRRFFNRLTGLFASVIFLLQPIAYYSSQQTLTDHALGFCLLLMLHAILAHDEKKDTRWLYLAGILGGMACGIKFNALVPVAVMILMAGRRWWRVLIPVLIVGSPWYIPNIVFFGNPLYPYYQSLFSWIPGARPGLEQVREQMHRTPTYEIGPLWLAPWNTVFREILPWAEEGIPGRVGPFLLALTPSLVLVKWKRPAVLMGIFLIVIYAYWFLYERFYNARYLMYAFDVHGILVSWGLIWLLYKYAKLRNFSPANRWHLAILGLVILAFGIFSYSVTLKMSAREGVYTFWERQNYMVEQKPGWALVHHMNKEIPDARVYGAGCDDYRFYADFDMIGARWGPDSLRDFNENGQTSDQLHRWLTSLGCEWLLLSETGLTYQNFHWPLPPAFSEDPAIFNQYFTEVVQPPEIRGIIGDFRLFRVNPIPTFAHPSETEEPMGLGE